jgi:hypothetical protein
MTSEEIRAIDVTDSSSVVLLLRELVAQLADIAFVLGDDLRGMNVQVSAKYEGGLLVMAQSPHEGEVEDAG